MLSATHLAAQVCSIVLRAAETIVAWKAYFPDLTEPTGTRCLVGNLQRIQRVSPPGEVTGILSQRQVKVLHGRKLSSVGLRVLAWRKLGVTRPVDVLIARISRLRVLLIASSLP